MFRNRKGAAKILASALDKYPSQFGKFHMVDQNNPNNNMKWSDYLESLKPKPVFELAAISADKKYMWYKRSDDKWNSDANDSALSRYNNLTDAKEVMNQIVVGTLPNLAVYIGVWNVDKKDWASDLTKVKLSEAADSKEMTDIDNRAYRFRRDEIGQWADTSLDDLVIDHGVGDEELMGDDA